MSTFFKAQRQDPALLDTVQRQLDALAPVVDAELRRGSQEAIRTGRPAKETTVQVWNRIAKENGVRFPDGYNVSPDGKVQYTNQTPWLQQLAWASLPIGAPSAAQAIFGGGGAAAGAGASAGGPAATEAAIWGSPAAAAAGYGGAGSAAQILKGLGGTGAQQGGSLLEQFVRTALGLAPAIGAATMNTGPSAEERALMDAARKTQELQMQRINYQNPLFRAATQLAMNRLPTNVQQPITGGFT